MTEFVLTSLVNSILNSDGTITVSSATGNVTLSLALGHINMWTAAQNNTSSWSSYVLSTDTYPQAELVASGGGGGQLLLGIGGATSPTVTLQYGGAPGVLYLTTGVLSHSANMVVFGNAPGSGDSNAILTLYGIAGTNFEYMVIDAIQQTSYVWNTIFGGSGANRPIVFESNSTEAFRITTTPNVQLASTVNLNWNNDTFIQRNGAASIQIVGGTSVATKFYISDLGVNDFIITTGSPTTINTDGSVALVFQSGGNEAFRITSTPIVQMAVPMTFVYTGGNAAINVEPTGGYAAIEVTSPSSSYIAFFESTVLGVQNWSWGTRTTGNWVLNAGNGLGGTDVITVAPSGISTYVEAIQFSNVAMSPTGYPAIYSDTSGDLELQAELALYMGGGGSGTALEINSSNLVAIYKYIYYYNGISTVANGVPSEYASTSSAAVSLQTTSTSIKSYTPASAGQFLVLASAVCKGLGGTTLTSLTVTYTDYSTSTTATQTLASGVVMSVNTAITYEALCNATTASAISVQGSCATGANDIYVSASIFAL
jgi:hypothetical protein